MEAASSSSSSSARPPATSTGTPGASAGARRQNPVLSEQQIHMLKQDGTCERSAPAPTFHDTVIETKSVHPDDLVLCHLFCACFERPKSGGPKVFIQRSRSERAPRGLKEKREIYHAPRVDFFKETKHQDMKPDASPGANRRNSSVFSTQDRRATPQRHKLLAFEALLPLNLKGQTGRTEGPVPAEHTSNSLLSVPTSFGDESNLSGEGIGA
eukprot:g26815.t1